MRRTLPRVATAVLLALCAVLLWWRTRPDPDDGRTRGVPTAATPTRSTAPPRLRPIVVDEPTPPAPGLPPAASAATGPGRDYLALYRGLSGRLARDARPDGAEPTTRNSSRMRSPQLMVWVPRVRVDPDGTTIRATLADEAGPVRPDRIEVQVERNDRQTASVSTTAPRPMAPAPPGSDAHYQLSFHPDPSVASATGEGRATRPPPAFHYLVRAVGGGDTPFERTAGGLFWVHDPGAALAAGTLELKRRAGDLVLTSQAQVDRAGRYWAYGELWGGEGAATPIAFARAPLGPLPPGRHPVTLLFGGQVIGDSGIDGPYTVRNVRLKQVDTHPAHEADPIATLPPTPPWRAADFR